MSYTPLLTELLQEMIQEMEQEQKAEDAIDAAPEQVLDTKEAAKDCNTEFFKKAALLKHDLIDKKLFADLGLLSNIVGDADNFTTMTYTYKGNSVDFKVRFAALEKVVMVNLELKGENASVYVLDCHCPDFDSFLKPHIPRVLCRIIAWVHLALK